MGKAATKMDGAFAIDLISVSNVLSFGPDGVDVSLKPLNVFVGPNGSGKSNFIEVLRLFQSLPNDLNQTFIKGGGKEHWDYKGERKNHLSTIKLTTLLDETIADVTDDHRLEHQLNFHFGFRKTIDEEEISLLMPIYGEDSKDPINQFTPVVGYEEQEGFYLYSWTSPTAMLAHSSKGDEKVGYPNFVERYLDAKSLKPDQSILSQRNDPESYPALFQLSTLYKGIHIFSETVLGRSSPARLPQDAALDSTFLFPDASNLALVLNDLQNQPPVMKTIIEKLKLFYERAENIITRVQGGTVQIFFQEEGLTQTVPASRLSDGTLRYLCLLVILCHPSPPPLICIEEPELGMHPDVLPTIAELLIEASQRTQLIITTHSDLLVSAIGGKHPEAIVVCEKGDSGTTMKRLEPEKMQEWLTRYSLGDLWLKGEIGGTRW